MNGKFKVDNDDIEELKNMPVCAEYFLISFAGKFLTFTTFLFSGFSSG